MSGARLALSPNRSTGQRHGGAHGSFMAMLDGQDGSGGLFQLHVLHQAPPVGCYMAVNGLIRSGNGPNE